MTRENCEKILINEGDFLIRSNSHPGTIILSNRQSTNTGDYNHLHIEKFSEKAFFGIVRTKIYDDLKLINQK
jgi:hypothetical protein